MVMMRDPNWTGPGPGPMIDVPAVKPAAAKPAAPAATTGSGGGLMGANQDVAPNPFGDIPNPFGDFNLGDLRDPEGRYPMDEGYGTGGGDGGGGDGGGGSAAPSKTPEQIAAEAKKTDAKIVLQNELKRLKLESLSAAVDKLWDTGQLEDANMDRFIFLLKDTKEFKDRFVGNVGRVAAGFLELSPSEYLDQESSYKDVLRANGLPSSFYDSEDDFAKLIGGTVSPAELQSRIVDGFNAVKNADPEVKRQMKELYGVSDADLAAYFIDPERVRPLLVASDYKRQADAAKIAAKGFSLAGIQLTGGLAEGLVRQGIDETEAETGFTAISKLGELTTQLGGETALSQEQIIGQQFGTDTAAKQELEKRRRRRVGEFAGGGGFARTQGETSGAITTAVGTAQ